MADGTLVEGVEGSGVLDKVDATEDRRGTDKDTESDLTGTPQKNANKKKARKDREVSHQDTTIEGSAASLEEDRREQWKY
jgi:hypothetical protein